MPGDFVRISGDPYEYRYGESPGLVEARKIGSDRVLTFDRSQLRSQHTAALGQQPAPPAARQAGPPAVLGLLKSALGGLPLSHRLFAQFVAGDTSEITESDLNPDELEALRAMTQGKRSVSYPDYDKMRGARIPRSLLEEGRARESAENTEAGVLSNDMSTSLARSFGRAKVVGKGKNRRFVDTYEFNDRGEKETRQVFDDMSILEKALYLGQMSKSSAGRLFGGENPYYVLRDLATLVHTAPRKVNIKL